VCYCSSIDASARISILTRLNLGISTAVTIFIGQDRKKFRLGNSINFFPLLSDVAPGNCFNGTLPGSFSQKIFLRKYLRFASRGMAEKCPLDGRADNLPSTIGDPFGRTGKSAPIQMASGFAPDGQTVSALNQRGKIVGQTGMLRRKSQTGIDLEQVILNGRYSGRKKAG
jgi:hypothetical protein